MNSICFKLYRTYSNRTLLICQMLANLFWGLILKDCIAVQEKKKKVLVFCWRSPQNVNLARIFTSQSCSDSKEMYKKVGCTCKVVFCQSKPISIAFLPLSLSLLSPSPLLKLPIVYKRLGFVKKKTVLQLLSLKESSCLVLVLYGKRQQLTTFLSCSRPLQNPWN